MAIITYYDKRFESPEPADPANLALQLQRLAEQWEPPMLDLQGWLSFLTSGASLTEVSTPAVWRSSSGLQTGYIKSIERTVLWDTTLFDNTGGSTAQNDLILPDQDQRYWWWMGCNLLLPAIDDNARQSGRIYVQDRDPATGQVITTVSRYNQYMRTEGEQYMTWDGLYRTGGGRQKVTYAHGNNSGNSTVLAGSSMWAIRICPDR